MGTFTINLGEYAKRTGKKLDTLVREVVIELGSRVVNRTPVGDPDIWLSLNPVMDIKTRKLTRRKAPAGYVGGRARANWQYSFGSAADGELFSVGDKSFPGAKETRAKIMAGIKSAPAAGVHFIANNLPYSERLENGWSSQAPAGMVALTVVEFHGVVRDEIARLPS